jgi:hypothetical protein
MNVRGNLLVLIMPFCRGNMSLQHRARRLRQPQCRSRMRQHRNGGERSGSDFRAAAAACILLLIGGTLPAAANAAKSTPPRPFKAVTVTIPPAIDDPAFVAFRQRLGDVAERKDKAALSALIVPQGYFWVREPGTPDEPDRPALDRLVAALGLDGADTTSAGGWATLHGYAQDPVAAPAPGRKDTVCAPAEPLFNEPDLQNAIKATGTDAPDWAYLLVPNVPLRERPQADAPARERLPQVFVRMLPNGAADDTSKMLRIVAPSGKTGYVSSDAVAPLGTDQICYMRTADGWKIGGYIGSGEAP